MRIKLEMEIETSGRADSNDAERIVECMTGTLNWLDENTDDFWREALAGSDIDRKIKGVKTKFLKVSA